VIPLVDAVGNVGTVPPLQILKDVPKLNVGVMFGDTVTVNEVEFAHCPPSGVKLYVPEFWLSTNAGLQVPVIPFEDVIGSEGTLPPAQMESEVPKLNVGVTIGLTVTVNVVGTEHCPAVGVNVYVFEFWLSTVDGDQVPVIPLPDVVGSDGTAWPAQIVNVVPKLNVGVMFGFTVTEKTALVAH
jgi:hypothetical protein